MMSSFHVVEDTIIVSHGLALAREQDKNHMKIKQSSENNVTAVKYNIHLYLFHLRNYGVNLDKF